MAAPTPEDTRILLHFNGADGSTTFTDSSESERTFLSVGDSQLDTAQKQFGTASLQNTTGTVYTTDLTGITITDDFQVDCHVRPSGSGVNLQVFASIQRPALALLGLVYNKPTGTIELYSGGGSTVVSSAVTAGTWNHVRWTHISDTHKLYLNGVLQGSVTQAVTGTPEYINFAGIGNTAFAFNGHLDEIRLAMAAEDDGDFTPPTSEYDDTSARAYIAVDSPLGELQSLAVNGVGGFIAQGNIFGDFAATAFHDFAAFIDYAQPMRYVMDLETPDGLVRVPISSWQATLNVGRSGYGQAVIPNATDYVDAINAATEFVVSRQMTLFSGTVVLQEMTRTPADYVTLSQGPNNYTATIYGYPAEVPLVEDPDVLYDRTLTGIRSMTVDASGTRVRCAIDYLLKPGQRAYAGLTPIIVSYINYYVPGIDEYMDIGERLT